MARSKPKRKIKKRVDGLVKKTNQQLPGLCIAFEMEDPLGDHDKAVDAKVWHENPVIRIKLMCDKYWKEMKKVLALHPVKWKITINMTFSDGVEGIDSREMVGVYTLNKLKDKYLETVESMFQEAVDKNYIDQYVNTVVSQQVLSGRVVKEGDFDE